MKLNKRLLKLLPRKRPPERRLKPQRKPLKLQLRKKPPNKKP